jgi:CRISPR-associated endoribonuclease Cas6
MADPELARLEIPVRWESASPSGHSGRALNAWFYGALARRDEALADALHSLQGPKPFTIALAAQKEGLALVITGCREAAPHVLALAQGCDRLLLDGRWLVACGEPRVRAETFAELATRWLLGDGRTIPVRLEFLSPTTFHSRGRTLPLPVPDLVFGGLLERWQAWSGIDLGGGAAVTVSDHAALRRHRLWTEMVQMEGRHTACRGYAEFTLVKPDPAYAGLLALLAAFAEYAGVGQKTAMGLGCVRFSPAGSRPAGAVA